MKVRCRLQLNGGDAVIEVLDVNGDGRADLLTNDRPTAPPGVNRGARMYRLYIAGQQLPYPKPIDLGKGLRPYVADVNGNGKDDLVLVTSIVEGEYEVASELKVLISRGDGTFAPRQPFRISRNPQFGQTRRLLARDINHDGLPDLVIKSQHDLVVLRGIREGDFAPADVRYIPNRYFGGWDMKVADIDGDNHLDIALGRAPEGARVLRRRDRPVPALHLGNDSRSCATFRASATTTPARAHARAVRAAGTD